MVMKHRSSEVVDFRSVWRSAVLVAVVCLSAVTAVADAVVREVSGRVELGRGEPPAWSVLEKGTTLAAADRIRTGPDGRVELGVDAGTLRVHENSLLRLPAASANTDRVELEAGHSLFDVLRREGRLFEVKTPTVVVSVKGTRFGVEAGAGEDVVSVFRGVVGVRDADADAALKAVETLVREGFLASGGAGRPFELDVLPAGDPWTAWQDHRSGHGPNPAATSPDTELDRAKTSLRRATDGEVIKRAADRRPEIAERLRQHAAEAKAANAHARDEKPSDEKAPRADGGPVPASPAVVDSTDGSGRAADSDARSRDAGVGLGDPPTGGKDAVEGGSGGSVIDPSGSGPIDLGVRDPQATIDRLETTSRDGARLPATDDAPNATDTQRAILDTRRAEAAMDRMEATVDIPALTGGTTLTNGDTSVSTDQLANYDPLEVMLLREALTDLQATSGSLVSPLTEADMVNFLLNDLTTKGMDANTADQMVRSLFR